VRFVTDTSALGQDFSCHLCIPSIAPVIIIIIIIIIIICDEGLVQ
jgi:hypothetical protein